VCVVSLKILTLFGIKGKPLVALSAFMIFYPRGIHFAASLNNDGVAYMFSVMALYFALKWWKKGKRLPDILLCAASIGLGMMSKLSSATVCLPVAGVFIYEFVRTLKKKEDALTLKNMIVQYATFLIICAPLGLWFQVYAKIRFDQSFGYVFSGITSKLSTADRTLFQRLFPIAFDAKEYFSSLWCNTFTTATSPNNYNLFHFALRSSIFGEQTYSRGESFAIPAVIFAYIAVILLLISLIRAVYLYIRYDRKRSDEGAIEGRKNALFVLLLVASQVLSEIYFYIKMPYACTMDFRYIMPLILGMCLTLWLVCGRLSRAGDGFSVTLCRLTVLSVAAFLVCSVLFYAVCV
jgi:4-amino-4-deoxy-L-arabinose transferase-like glycosyltransferase